MPVNKIDSNVTGLAIAEELDLKTLPGTPVWYGHEPNSYEDTGGEITTVARDPINASRQRRKGSVTDLDAVGGFNSDFTANNMRRLLQGFCFADTRENPTTIPLNAAAVPLTSVAVSGVFNAASGLGNFKVGMLARATGFTNAPNNAIGRISAATATQVTTNIATVAEASPPAAARLEAVGIEFGSGLAAITISAGIFTLTASGVDFTTMSLSAGEWVYIGGDLAAQQFATGRGYARVRAIVSATVLTFDKATWTVVADTGTAKTVQMFVGDFLRNEDNPALIKRRSYQLERQLGINTDVGSLQQAEYVEGAIPNELTFNVPQADKLNIDLSFIGLNTTYRDSVAGPKTGTRVAALGESAFNTSSDIFRIRLSTVDPVNLSPTALVGYISELTLKVNNNVSPAKAVGVLGAFDATAGTFEVGGDLTAYFTQIAAVNAIRANADVTIDAIIARNNVGMVIDVPLLSLGGGKLNVEKDTPITLPLETMGAQSLANYTLGFTFFKYLPTVAMPT
jgi:Phage tail tube protein